ncbi:MAG TPA: glycosyltransferase family 2 protein [Actinomycetota bacterium]|nr:glycosyltransferase family 2 protein [Actinomycetota bacterium]
MTRVIITMPAYRAEATLEKTVAGIPPGIADELILVDDASSDNTAELARSLGISVFVHPQNRGYGGNQKTCYTKALQSGADIVVMLHPDYQYEPKSVPLLIAPILAGEADMTFGSRFAGLGDPRAGGMPMYRFLGNRITTTLENLLLGSRFSEMHSGMRAYTRRCLLSLPFLGYSEDFSFDGQFMVDAVTSGQRVVEVPIPTRYTKESSSIGIGRSLRYVGMSLLYAGRRSVSRGRRGRRNPVVTARAAVAGVPPPRDDASPAGTAASAAELDAVGEALCAYVTSGNRLLQLDSAGRPVTAPAGEAWRGVTTSSGDEAACDAAVVWSEGSIAPAEALRRAAGAVVSEGLVALVLRGAKDPDPRAVSHLFEAAGARMIEWSTLSNRSSRSSRATVVIGRAREQGRASV